MIKKDSVCCSECRFFSGWDGGFDGEPFVTECVHFGMTSNRTDCTYFRRPLPSGYRLLEEFRVWFNGQGFSCDECNQLVVMTPRLVSRFLEEYR